MNVEDILGKLPSITPTLYDLKIGNNIMIDFNGDIIVEVTGLDRTDKNDIVKVKFDNNEMSVLIDKVKPILLNNDTLALLGWKRKEEFADGIGMFDWFEKKNYSTIHICHGVTGIGYYDDIKGFTHTKYKLRYVHQMQNACYDLMKEMDSLK